MENIENIEEYISRFNNLNYLFKQLSEVRRRASEITQKEDEKYPEIRILNSKNHNDICCRIVNEFNPSHLLF